MNVPGVKFNNRNWPHIVRTLRLSLCLCMILFPIINIVAGSIVADVWENIGKYVFLAMFLCGVLLQYMWLERSMNKLTITCNKALH